MIGRLQWLLGSDRVLYAAVSVESGVVPPLRGVLPRHDKGLEQYLYLYIDSETNHPNVTM